MIKLIASDADGTLTEHGANTLSEGVIKGINAAMASGVKFAVVSGRDHLSLKKLFFGVADGVYYVSCNGALCIKDGKTLYSRPVARENVIWALSYAKKTDTGCVFCSDDEVCVYGDDAFFEKIQKMYGDGAKRVYCNVGVSGNVYKISFYRGSNTGADMGDIPFFLRMSYDRNGWTEFVNRFVNKGGAVFDLQSRLGVSAKETAAFGDELSDADMLARAASRYATTDKLAEAADAVKVTSAKQFFDIT